MSQSKIHVVFNIITQIDFFSKIYIYIYINIFEENYIPSIFYLLTIIIVLFFPNLIITTFTIQRTTKP